VGLKEEICDSTVSENCKGLKKGAFENADKAVVEWFKATRSQNISVSGALIVEKALKFAKIISRQAPADSTIESVYINRYTFFFKKSGFGQYSEWDDSFSVL
jgi:hypothetical protein